MKLVDGNILQLAHPYDNALFPPPTLDASINFLPPLFIKGVS